MGNILMLFGKPRVEKEQKEEELSFIEIMQKNKEKEERLKKERVKNNKDVTQSYRLRKR